MTATVSPSTRLTALDVFRGMTIALMFIVNNPGTWDHIYAPFEHATWHGCTPTDWVFPFFLFASGISSWFSLKQYQQGHTPTAVYQKIWIRGAKIFLIGLGLALFLNTLSSYHNLRIFGVLQRIGLAYALGATLCVSFKPRTLAIIGGVILLAYWLLLMFNGGWDSPMAYLGTRIDKAILGDTHMYHITWAGVEGKIAFDPEGILSAIPAVVTVILGYLLGMLIDSTPDRRRLVLLLVPVGLSAMALSLIWHFLSFPINKSIWSSSYVLYTAGVATIIIAVLIFFLDILQFRALNKPFLILGMNSILAFALAGIVAKITFRWKFEVAGKLTSLSSYIFRTFFKDLSLSDPRVGSMAYALCFMTFLWLILWVFYERKIFLKV